MRGYELLTTTLNAISHFRLRIPMRGYETRAVASAISVIALRIPMRGYEKSQKPETQNSKSYESP